MEENELSGISSILDREYLKSILISTLLYIVDK